MSEFTPTTQQVRDGYRYDPEAEYHDPITPHHVTNGRAFDRWYAAEIAAAKAESLREAAGQLIETRGYYHDSANDRASYFIGDDAAHIVGGWLFYRADQIESES